MPNNGHAFAGQAELVKEEIQRQQEPWEVEKSTAGQAGCPAAVVQ